MEHYSWPMHKQFLKNSHDTILYDSPVIKEGLHYYWIDCEKSRLKTSKAVYLWKRCTLAYASVRFNRVDAQYKNTKLFINNGKLHKSWKKKGLWRTQYEVKWFSRQEDSTARIHVKCQQKHIERKIETEALCLNTDKCNLGGDKNNYLLLTYLSIKKGSPSNLREM